MKKKRHRLRETIPKTEKRRKVLKKSHHKIFRTEDLPMTWVVCQSTKRKTKKGKIEYFQKQVGLPVCIVRSQQLHPLYEDCYGCTKWHDYVLVKGGKYVKRRQKIEKAIKRKKNTIKKKASVRRKIS